MATSAVEELVAEQSAEIKELRTQTVVCQEQLLQQQVELEEMKQQVWEWRLCLERCMTYVVIFHYSCSSLGVAIQRVRERKGFLEDCL